LFTTTLTKIKVTTKKRVTHLFSGIQAIDHLILISDVGRFTRPSIHRWDNDPRRENNPRPELDREEVALAGEESKSMSFSIDLSQQKKTRILEKGHFKLNDHRSIDGMFKTSFTLINDR